MVEIKYHQPHFGDENNDNIVSFPLEDNWPLKTLISEMILIYHIFIMINIMYYQLQQVIKQ